MVMVIYCYVEIFGKFSLTLIVSYNIYNHQTYYLGETVNIHIQSSTNIIHEKNWEITTKKGKGKLPLPFVLILNLRF